MSQFWICPIVSSQQCSTFCSITTFAINCKWVLKTWLDVLGSNHGCHGVLRTAEHPKAGHLMKSGRTRLLQGEVRFTPYSKRTITTADLPQQRGCLLTGVVLGAGVGGVGAWPPAGEDWYAGVGMEGALGSLAMLCCKSLIKDKSFRD